MSRGIPPTPPEPGAYKPKRNLKNGPSYSFGKAERFPKQKQSETPGPGAYNPNELKSSPSHSFPKEKRFQNSINTISNFKKARDLIPPLTKSPVRIIAQNKIDPIDQMILKDSEEAGNSVFKQKDPEHLRHTYQFQNKDKTKTLEFIGISHLDNLKRHIENHPLKKEAIKKRITEFMERLATVIKESNPNHATLIVEGMDIFTSEKSKESQKTFINHLKKNYPTMNWENPNVEAFINLPNARELEFAVLMAFEKGMNILSSESDKHQVIELCNRLESRDLMPDNILPDQSELDLKECAFFYFCCRDLIRWHSSEVDDDKKSKHLETKIQDMINRYSKISTFDGYTFETIKKVSQSIWGERKLYHHDVAIQMEQLIEPYPMKYIKGLSDIPEDDKKRVQIMNHISQLLTLTRNRQIIDESIRAFESQEIVIPVFGSSHGYACFHAFEYVMQNI